MKKIKKRICNKAYLTFDFIEQITISHTWSEQGRYTIKCKAKDPYDAEGPLGELNVTMPRNKIAHNTPFLKFLQRHPNLFPILQTLLQRLGLQ